MILMNNAAMTLTKNNASYTYTAQGETVRVTNSAGMAYTVPTTEAKRAIRDRLSRGWVEA
jgi:hypothetical protein